MSPKCHRAVSVEACYQWVLLNVQISTRLFYIFGTEVHLSYNDMNEDFESAGEWTCTQERGEQTGVPRGRVPTGPGILEFEMKNSRPGKVLEF